jgi:hypothetical protein
MGVSSRCALAVDMLLAAHLDNQHEGGCRRASPQARNRHALPSPKGNKHGKEPGCWMLLH